MAGDWIKVEKCLVQKPEVFQIASMTGIDHWSVVGRLIEVWSWADAQTENGVFDGISTAIIDRLAGYEGFAKAMAATKPSPWLVIDERGFSIPAYDRHNGKSAKKRALNNRRIQDYRTRHGIKPPPNAIWKQGET